jgi:hypothetical protein
MLVLSLDRYPGNRGALFGLLLILLQIGGIALPPQSVSSRDRASLPLARTIVVISCVCVAIFVALALRPDRVESGSTSEETA